MNLSQEQIQQILYQLQDPEGLMDIFAEQERARLVELLHNVISEFVKSHPIDSIADYQHWAGSAKQVLIKEINKSEDAFGIKDLSRKLPLDQFLNKFYELEYNL